MTELIRNIERSLDAYNTQDFIAAFNFATLAIEGTARNWYNKDYISRRDYINLLRNYYWIMEPFMGLPECETWKFYPGIKITDEKGRVVGGCFGPDLAEIVYHVFRCNIHHGKSIPSKFNIMGNTSDPSLQIISIDSNNIMQLNSNIIIALLAVCMGCVANKDLGEKSDYYLTLNTNAAILTLKKCDDSETETHLDVLAIKTNEQKFPFQKFFGKEKLLKNIMKSVSRQPLISGILSVTQPTKLTYTIHYI